MDEHTHSAAEMVVAFANENGPATLIGTTRAGEVMGRANFTVVEGYRLRIPVTTWQTWKGMEIEGASVPPDVLTDLCAQQSATGNDGQLSAAIKFRKQQSQR